jgi:hypothetical protein
MLALHQFALFASQGLHRAQLQRCIFVHVFFIVYQIHYVIQLILLDLFSCHRDPYVRQ